jgi:hypothetical protein
MKSLYFITAISLYLNTVSAWTCYCSNLSCNAYEDDGVVAVYPTYDAGKAMEEAKKITLTYVSDGSMSFWYGIEGSTDINWYKNYCIDRGTNGCCY